MVQPLVWWFVISLLGWAVWPLARQVFAFSPGRGWPASRLLGLVLAAFLYWVGSILTPIPAGRTWALMAALLCLLGGAVAWWRLLRTRPCPLAGIGRDILTTELLFAAVWIAYLVFRGGTPAIHHTEQPMDLAMLSATLHSRQMPPMDPWLAGEPVSYYYGGYLLVGLLAHITATPAPTAYNLGLALYAALAVLSAYGALQALLAPGASSVRGRWVALLGALAIMGCSNLQPALEFLHARYGMAGLADWFAVPGLADAPITGRWLPADNWWWRASRIATDIALWGRPDTLITEFPAFGFILGDLHPHLMGLPFLGFSMLVAVERQKQRQRGLSSWSLLAVSALVLGYAGFANTWDLPVVAATIGIAWGLGAWARSRSLGRSLVIATLVTIGVLGASLLLYLPFYAQFGSQAEGLGTVILTRTRLRTLFLHLGAWYLPILLDQLARPHHWKRVIWLWLAFSLMPWLAILAMSGPGTLGLAAIGALSAGPWVGLALAGVLALVVDDLAGLCADRGAAFSELALSCGALAFIGTSLVLGAELYFVRDLFGTRMNTVFKLYQQAWVFLGLAACCAIYRLYGDHRAHRWTLLPVALCLLLTMPYLPLAAQSRWVAYEGPRTLDGASYLAIEDPDAYASYRWLAQNKTPGDVLAEAPGASYEPATSRLSALTGVPTVLGWQGHQVQWRGHDAMLAPRIADLEAIYTSRDSVHVRTVLAEYGVRYVHVGPRERALYDLSEEHVAWLATWLDPVFASGEVLLLEVTPAE